MKSSARKFDGFSGLIRSVRPGRKRSVGKERQRTRPVCRVEALEPRLLLAGDLIAQWQAEDLDSVVDAEGRISTWTDSVSGIEATARGEPQLIRDAIGGRAVVRFDPLDGDDGLRVRRDVNPLSGANDFSIAVAFATDATTLVGETGSWFENTGLVDANQIGLSRDWGMSINAAGQISAGMGAGIGLAPSTLYSSTTGLNDGQLHVAVFTRSGGTMSLYIDGAAADMRSDANPDARVESALAFGQLVTGGNAFAGDIAEIRIYDGALDTAEAASVFNQITSFYTNSRPTAVDDQYTISEDSLVFNVSAIDGLLANDTDTQMDPLTVELIDDVQFGTLILNPDGSFFYGTEKDFFGTATFTYQARDFGPSNIATVTIEVTPVYDPAVPMAETYKLLPSGIQSVDAETGVLVNDVNVDRSELTAVLDTNVANGSLTLNSDGSFSYDAQGFAGTTSFSYRIDDGTQLSRSSTVTLLVNAPPVALDDTFDITEDTLFTTNAAQGILANDSDAENDTLTTTLLTEPSNGTLSLNPDGSFSYDPAPDFFGLDTFTYKLADWIDESGVATARLNVIAVDDSPVANPDAYYGLPGQAITTPANKGPLANDTDVDSLLLSAELVTGPTSGLLDMNPDGSFLYTPNATFTGVDAFTYKVSDGNSQSEVVEVQLFVGTSPIRISEFLAANASSLSTRTRASTDDSFEGIEEREDWIEIQNLTDGWFDLGGFYLTDNNGDLERWQFPDQTMIPPSGYLTVFASRLDITNPELDEQGMLHTNFTLKVEGEYLAVTSPDGILLHEFDPYPRQAPNVSYGLSASGEPAHFVAATPGANNSSTYLGLVANTAFSVERGFYSDPFSVEISTPMEGAEIRYTTDGSTPTLANGTVYSGPIEINTTATLRTGAFKEGYVPSEVDTATYIFVQDVIQQGNSPAGYPTEWKDGRASPLTADYEMDPEITNNPAYRDIIDDALLGIPTVSIVTDIDNLFDPDTGIYMNPEERGVEWERPASIEVMYPDGTQGFQENAGLRIQGGFGRKPKWSPKHSFRLLFKGIYGAGKLQFPLFGDDAVDELDTVIFRAGFGQAWIHENSFIGDSRNRAQYIRDQWAKDTQLAMGYVSANNDYFQLYVNGIYWGMYNASERPNAAFAAAYFGGQKEDYDVINSSVPIAGDLEAWRQMFDMANAGLEGDQEYQAFTEILDIDAFIDYMVLNQYGGNMDWEGHNWYAIRKREPGSQFRFITWDSENMFISLRDSRLNLNSNMLPGRLLNKLLENDDFRIEFADHVQRHFFNGGLLTPESSIERWEARAEQIFEPIVAESARWGDYRRDVHRFANGPYQLMERDVQWAAERNRLLTSYFPQRTGVVLSQYRRKDWFPSIDAPTFSQRGGTISDPLDVELSATEGTIYFTTDGSDPRLPGGPLNPNAMEYTGAIRLTDPTTIRARAFSEDEWSTIDEAAFVGEAVSADATSLRISEINYNPGDPTESEVAAGYDNNDDFEFIELVNISSERIDLTKIQFRRADFNGQSEGVDFDFSTGAVTQLEPGQYVLVVEDVAAFAFRYGDQLPVAGQWAGRLSNGGEQITLTASDDVIHGFAYADEWFEVTDGGGSTLEAVSPANPDLDSWGQRTNWSASIQEGGTPGRPSTTPLPGDSNGDGVFNSSDLILVFQAGEYEDGVPGNSTFEEGDWDRDGDFTSADLVLALQAGTYIVAARLAESQREVGNPTDRVLLERDRNPTDREFFLTDDAMLSDIAESLLRNSSRAMRT